MRSKSGNNYIGTFVLIVGAVAIATTFFRVPHPHATKRMATLDNQGLVIETNQAWQDKRNQASQGNYEIAMMASEEGAPTPGVSQQQLANELRYTIESQASQAEFHQTQTSSPPPSKPVLSRAEGKHLWRVQVASFETSKHADKFTNTLRDKGFSAYTARANTSLGVRYRIYIGPVTSSDKANEVAGAIKQQYHMACLIAPITVPIQEGPVG